jgi:isopentenyl diphosphate isomerase/L-lactate dehydrogenase-like FMN-dependent dehydrogenase
VTVIEESADFVTIDQIIARARRVTDPALHVWAEAAAGEEVTAARNVIALNAMALIGRVCIDVASVDLTTSFLGVPMAMPVFFAPVGALSLYHPGGALAVARAASAAGVSTFCGMLVADSWEEVAATAPQRHFFQMYVGGDRPWLADVMARVEEAGFAGLAVTVDTPVIGRRDRSLSSGFTWKAGDDSDRNLARHGGSDMEFRRRFGWAELEWICAHSALPVILKGVLAATDAERAVEAGVKAVYVSNHGGRVVDHGVSSIEVLGEVVAAIDGRAEVLVDSGFMRGPDVIKGLALGARAVGLGRLQCWALAAGGFAAALRLLEILREELEITMGNLGQVSVADMSPKLLRQSHPTL